MAFDLKTFKSMAAAGHNKTGLAAAMINAVPTTRDHIETLGARNILITNDYVIWMAPENDENGNAICNSWLYMEKMDDTLLIGFGTGDISIDNMKITDAAIVAFDRLEYRNGAEIEDKNSNVKVKAVLDDKAFASRISPVLEAEKALKYADTHDSDEEGAGGEVHQEDEPNDDDIPPAGEVPNEE